jgi:predicted nucleic acid-binding protein
MRLYLDSSALNRIFDDQTQARVDLESTAITVRLSTEISDRAQDLEKQGMKALDALHLASAERFFVDAFITCDDRILKKKCATVRVVSPVQFVADLLHQENENY